MGASIVKTGIAAICVVGVVGMLVSPHDFGAQQLTDAEIEIPGMGVLKLSEFPPEMQKYVRIPGFPSEEPLEEYGDLPPAPFGSSDALTEDTQPEAGRTSRLPPPQAQEVDDAELYRRSAQHRHDREAIMRRLYQERAFPSDRIPEDAYRKAWSHIQQMQEAEPPIVPTPAADIADKQASRTDFTSWLASAWRILSPRPAWGQVPPTYQWTQIGPAPLINEVGLNNAGFIESVTPDFAQDPTRVVYVTSVDGGIWKSTNVSPTGTIWTPLTDGQPSLQYATLAIHPQNSQWVFAGSGLWDGVPDLNDPKRSIGAIRSTDGGASWCQIGPVCSDDANCPPPNPDYTKSNLTVAQIAVENQGPNYRVWAATTRGLWWSDDAANLTSQKPCNQVTWTKSTLPAKKANGTTLDTVNHIFVSPSNPQILYASVVYNDKTATNNNGWWRSTTHDAAGSWQQVLSLQLGDLVNRASIRKNATGPDVIWSIVAGPSFCGGNTGLFRLYRTLNSGTLGSWQLLTTNLDCTELIRSVAIDPTDSTVVAVGQVPLYRSLNGTDPSPTFQSVGTGTIHVDHTGLAFAAHDILYDGNDGGMWQITNFSTSPNFINLNTNLANIQFYHGTTDTLNYGVSFGGTQDNSTIRGGTPLTWNLVIRSFSGDADGQFFIDPTNSNLAYYATFQQPYAVRSTGYSDAATTLLQTNFPANIVPTSLAMDPSPSGGNKVLVAFSGGTQKAYRTTNADTTASWSLITFDTGRPNNTLPGAKTLTVAPVAASQAAPSNKIFEATGDGNGLWCTNDASRWRGGRGSVPNHQLPGRVLTSVAIASSGCSQTQQPCTASCPCTLYVSAGGFDESASVPSHLFRSTNYTGQDCDGLSWDNISGTIDTCTGGICPSTGRACVNNQCPYYFPDLPANEVVVDPSIPNPLYVAADFGMFQGCLGCRSVDKIACNPSGTNFICNPSGTVWVWDKLTIGFPSAAWVTDLSLHQDSRMLRAWTYGRSVWEANLGNILNPDRKANSTNPVTDVQRPAISSTSNGDTYAAVWSDDRNGANRWHVQYRTFYADGSYITLLDVRVDDASDHIAQAPSVATNRIATTHDQCSWVAWHDDRLDRTNHYNHIFYTYICGDGYKPYADVQADTQAPSLNATYPAVVFQPSGAALASVVAWQADRSAVPSPSHDIYARRFSAFGPAGPPLQVNSVSMTSNATLPALAIDANSNTYVAWEEREPGPNPPAEYKIFLSKYDINLGYLKGPIPIHSGTDPGIQRHNVAVAVDSQAGIDGPTVIVSWYEATGSTPEYVVRRRLQIPSAGNPKFLDTSPVQVNSPPTAPVGIQRAGLPSVATDATNNVVIAWEAETNGPSPDWNPFGKSFNSSGIVLKNDFRIDLAGRALAFAPYVARNSGAGKFSYAWRDKRSGHFDVYTRVVPWLP